MKFFFKTFSLLFSIILFLSFPEVDMNNYIDGKNIKTSAVIFSDVHVETNNFERFPRLGQMLNGVFSSEYIPDVIAFCGDSVMNGQELEWMDFSGFVNRYNKGSKVLMVCGNHELGNNADHDTYIKLSNRFIKNCNMYFDANINSLNYSIINNGFRYIVLGSDDNADNTVEVISDEQIDWLKCQLNECKKDNIPAFVFNHNMIYGTNGNQSYWDFNLTDNNDKLDYTLKNCGVRVVYFCGHSHFGINENTFYVDDNVVFVNLPTAGNENYDADGINGDYGNGLLMEIFDAKIVLKFRNFIEGEWIENYGSLEIDY